MGVPRGFVALGRGWWRCGGCWVRAVPSLRGGLPAAQLSVGYLFIIYGVWELSRDAGAEGKGGTMLVGEHVEGPARGLPARPGFVQVHAGAASKATAVAGGCKGGDKASTPGTTCVSPRGGTQGCLGGCMSAGEDPTLSPGFFLPLPVQPFSLSVPSPPLPHWGGGGGGVEGGGRVPWGRAGDALSLLLPFNKLVFL